jgi:hypothetical protein
MTASLYQLLTGFLCKIHSLGLNQKPVSLQALLDSNSEVDIKIVWRKRSDTSPIKLRSVLADTACYPGDAVVNAETGFYIVAPDESVIFVSSPAKGKLDRL